MGFSLKKSFKSLAPIVNPAWAASGGAAVNVLNGKNPLDFGSKPGPANPFAPPNLNDLLDYSSFNFLKKPVTDSVPNNMDSLFNDFISKIGAPSSVDEATKGIQGDILNQTLEGIDRDTAQAISSVHQDALDRGIGGPGLASEMESSGVGTAATEGARTKASARSSYALADLERQKQREQALQAAYGQRYNTGANIYSQLLGLESGRQGDLASIINNRDIARTTGQGNLFTAGQDAQHKYQKPSYLDDFLRNINIGFSPKV